MIWTAEQRTKRKKNLAALAASYAGLVATYAGMLTAVAMLAKQT